MMLCKPTAADITWREKADLNPSVVGAIVALMVVGLPLFLL